MANRIDGGSSTSVEHHAAEDVAPSSGAGGESTPVGDSSVNSAPGEPNQREEDSWGVGDAVGDFWEGVTGTASEATQAVKQSASEAAAGVGDALETFDAAMHEVAEVPDQIIDGGEELFEEFEQAKVAFASEMDQVIESHSPENIAKAAKDALDGAWNVTQDIAEAVERVDAGEIAADAVDGVVAGLDLVDEVQIEVRRRVVTAACESLSENQGLVEDTAKLLEESLSSDVLDAVSPFLAIAPFGGNLETARRSVLMLVDKAKHMPGLAKELLENPEAMEAFINPNGVERLSDRIAEVDVGEAPFVTRIDLELSGHQVVGGSIGGSSSFEVERRAGGVLRVTVEAEGKGALGIGAEAGGKGAKGDLGVGASGKMVIDFRGEDAEEQIARLIAGSRGEREEFLKLDEDMDATIVESSGTFGTSLSGDIGPLSGTLGLDSASKVIAGQPYVGEVGTFSVSAGVETAYLQTPDGFAEAVDASSLSSGNPLVDEMISAVPAELTEGVSRAYGPTAGLRLAGDVSAELGVYAPVGGDGGDGGLRLEFNRQATLQAGRSTFTIEHNMAVTDLEGLAKAVGRSPGALIEDLKGGDTTPQVLREALEERGEDIGRFLEEEGPTVTMSSLDGFDIGAGGQRFMEGRQRRGQVYPPPEGRTTLEQLDHLADEFSKPVESSGEPLIIAGHAQQLSP